MKDKFFELGGDTNLTHLTRDGKKAICGCKIEFPWFDRTELKEESGELKAFCFSRVQEGKWVIVARYNYCKRCLKIFDKNKE